MQFEKIIRLEQVMFTKEKSYWHNIIHKTGAKRPSLDTAKLDTDPLESSKQGMMFEQPIE